MIGGQNCSRRRSRGIPRRRQSSDGYEKQPGLTKHDKRLLHRGARNGKRGDEGRSYASQEKAVKGRRGAQ